GGPWRERRSADGSRLQRKGVAKRRSGQVLSAAHFRQFAARDLGRRRSGQAAPRHAHRPSAGDAQELVGMRHGDRIPRLGRGGLAHASHDPGVRPFRSRATEIHPQFRLARAAARRERRRSRGIAWPDFNRTCGQSRLLRIRDQQGWHRADRRPQETARRPGGADRRESDLSRSRKARAAAERRCTYRVSAAQDGPGGVRARHGGANARLRGCRDESILNECQEARPMLWIADMTAESPPFGVAGFTVPEASGNFCSRGGRFGTHSSNESFTPIYYRRILFLAYFNAGVRAVDIRDPYHPREVAHYIPAVTSKTEPRCVKVDGKDRCKV